MEAASNYLRKETPVSRYHSTAVRLVNSIDTFKQRACCNAANSPMTSKNKQRQQPATIKWDVEQKSSPKITGTDFT